MRAQLAWTMLTEVLVTVSGILILSLAASLLGPVGFGEYAISRRAVGLMYLPLVMGLGIAAPRYIAIARTGKLEGYEEGPFATATLTAGLVPPLVVVALLNLSPAWSAGLLFGTTSMASLVPAASLALLGLALHGMVYAIYRGRSQMGLANMMQLVNLGIVPLAAFALSDKTAESVLAATGTGWLVVSGAAMLHVAFLERSRWSGLATMKRHLAVLLRFGVPRIPGEFALIGMFAIPALIAVRVHGVELAGHFSAALSVLSMLSGAFAPVGLVVLPRASAQVAMGDIAGVRRLVLKILASGILLASVGVAIGELVLPRFIEWYFGPAFQPAVPIFRACLLGAIPHAVYILMRSILDALDVKALNSRNLVIALVVAAGLCLLNTSLIWMSFSIVAALTLLGALTLRDTFARLRVPSPSTTPIPA